MEIQEAADAFMSAAALAAGSVAGVAMGYVLYRGQLCFHSTFRGIWERRVLLLRGWLLGVAIAAVGLALLFTLPFADDLSRGLAFRPVANIGGGLLVGIGMAVARTCVSGLFYRLGSGMLGALVGLGAWIIGELLARRLTIPGPTLLPGGDEGTIPGILGLPRIVVAAVFLVVVVLALRRWPGREKPEHSWQWSWRTTGIALGLVTIAGWALAGLGGVDFGPSTVGASAGVAAGTPNLWLIAFLVAIVAGAAVAARRSGGIHVRGESPVRYVQLAIGGLLLGAGGWIAGGCNLGHGLSGVAQLNVSSWVVVAAIVLGIGLARAVAARAGRPVVRSA